MTVISQVCEPYRLFEVEGAEGGLEVVEGDGYSNASLWPGYAVCMIRGQDA